MTNARATFLLPAAERFGRQRLGAAAARALGHADRDAVAEPGRRAQLLRHFELVPRHWPIAALARQHEAGDAAGARWLRADPAHVRPDINGVRLLAYGDALALTEDDLAALLPALRPLFGDAGMPLDAASPSHWYLRVAEGATLPAFADPGDALGSDLFEHLAAGPEGRRWRTLLSEAQVILHHHPWNERRARAGRPTVNSLWFWGGGALPDRVASPHAVVHSDDEPARVLANAASTGAGLPARFAPASDDDLFDLQGERDLARLQHDWLLPAFAAIADGRLRRLDLDAEDGRRVVLARGQRWRFWRKATPDLGAAFGGDRDGESGSDRDIDRTDDRETGRETDRETDRATGRTRDSGSAA